MELLGLRSSDIVEAFRDRIEEEFDGLCAELEDFEYDDSE